MTEEELNQNYKDIETAVGMADQFALMGIAVRMLVRIVGAQEFVAELAKVDINLEIEETIKARRAFERRGWPTIDVTRRSVEETAAAILNLLNERRTKTVGVSW